MILYFQVVVFIAALLLCQVRNHWPSLRPWSVRPVQWEKLHRIFVHSYLVHRHCDLEDTLQGSSKEPKA